MGLMGALKALAVQFQVVNFISSWGLESTGHIHVVISQLLVEPCHVSPCGTSGPLCVESVGLCQGLREPDGCWHL